MAEVFGILPPDISGEPPSPTLPTSPGPRRQPLQVDRDLLSKKIVQMVDRDMDEREDRHQRRLARRAAVYGWQSQKDWPWPNAATVYLPIMQIANLKTRGTLENAIKSFRPVMEAKARKKENSGKEDAINRVLDYQFFGENPGEDLIDAYVTNFVEDEAAFLFANWVKESESYHDVRLFPPIADNPEAQLTLYLQQMFGPQAVASQKGSPWEWEVRYEEHPGEVKDCLVNFYVSQDERNIEAHIICRQTTHDGPCISVEDFEDVIFPARAANLQPPTASNPRGARYVARLTTVTKDTVRRRMADKTYDLLTADDWEKIEKGKSPVGTGTQPDEAKQQKDEMEGTYTERTTERDDLSQIVWFGREDVNGDGLEEDIIVWCLRDPDIVCKVVLLTEMYPGVPLRRPFSAKSFISIPNRVLGLSQSELLENIQSHMQTALEQHEDWGTITNTPFFTYRAASGMRPEPIRIEPAVGIPLDDPAGDINFPVWPTKDSAYALNTIALYQQFAERIQMFSDVSLGRVPMGRSSALRNVGSLTSLMGQADSRSEQVLRRLLSGLAEIFEIMHRLNRRFLPQRKEVRIIGVSEQGQDAYVTVDRSELDVDVEFEFKATLTNTNKQVLSQNLDQIIALAITPLAFQAGLADLESMYVLLTDKCKALDLEPDKYFKRPPQMPAGPKVLAEEVLDLILEDRFLEMMPVAQPLEGAINHLQKLMLHMSGPEKALFNPTQIQILDAWVEKLKQQVIQQQMMVAAMQQFQQQQGGGQQGNQNAVSGAPGPSGGAPSVQPNRPMDASINPGATNGGVM